ncbi:MULTISPECIES: PTS sugar transporter subunit IIC [unclassified Luteococcus]|uniref:PTS sugar transporter subunit IIC n=1 Tax=unclassified Luteococcus TaxID=2639923 RepID=UPI00313B7342
MAQSMDVINDKVITPILKFVNTRPVQALKNGMMFVMPLTIVGAIFLLLANFPVTAVVEWEKSVGLYEPFMQIYTATFDMLGLVACMGIAFSWVRDEGYDALPAAVWAACTMILLTPLQVLADGVKEPITGVIPLAWTGSKGMIGGILVAYMVGIVYTWFLKRDITIKMPDGVPPNVATAFTSLIPGTVIMIIGAIVFAIFNHFDTSMIEAIYKGIQTPLQGLSDSLGGIIIICIIIPLLWFFGVHGSSIVSGIMQPIGLANMQDNQKILDAGQALTVANGGHVLTQQFIDSYIGMTGSGVTIGIVIYMLVFAKSAQFKTLGKLGGAPAIFNINEPILFGTPIVMNPLLAIPFFVMPMINGLVTYFALYTGLVPLFTAVLVPWTTPPILSGMLLGGWKHAVLQAFLMFLSVVVYFVFARKVDSLAFAEEKAAADAEQAEVAAAELSTSESDSESETTGATRVEKEELA